MTSDDELTAWLNPARIAVVGASDGGDKAGNLFIRRLRAFGYEGEIYPIHPTSSTIEGIDAFPSIASIGKTIDYAYIALRADRIVRLIDDDCGDVRLVQIVSSGFAETGSGSQSEGELLAAAKRSRVRILGPNSLGMFSAPGRVSYMDNSPSAIGNVAMISQSGGLSVDIIRSGAARGVNYNCAFSIGNAVDIGAAELVAKLQDDDQTKVLALYLEGLADGRRFVEEFRRREALKPTLVLKGGQTTAGAAAARSHTGTLAGDSRIWTDVARQCGFVMVRDVDALIDGMVACSSLVPRSRVTRTVALLGNGGGYGVLGADALARSGFELPPPSTSVMELLEAESLPPGTGLGNPFDLPSAALSVDGGEIVRRVLNYLMEDGTYDAIVVNLNLLTLVQVDRFSETAQVARKIVQIVSETASGQRRSADGVHVELVLRTGGVSALADISRELFTFARLSGMPAFDSLAQAVSGLSTMRDHEAGIPEKTAAVDLLGRQVAVVG